MNVIYNTCFADPWVKVAENLKKIHNYNPVYWIGYEDDDSARIIPEIFPNAIYQSTYDAWKGIFPKEINDVYHESHINIDFLKENASYELQAMTMMDRMDVDRHSFNFMERERHFRNLIRYWTTCINCVKPDLVISASIPHRIYDYTLYLLCRQNNIKFISYFRTITRHHIVPVFSIDTIGGLIDPDHDYFLSNEFTVDRLKGYIDKEFLASYDKIQIDYQNGSPDYVLADEIKHKQSAGAFRLFKKMISDMHRYSEKYFGKNSFIIKGIPTYFKDRKSSIENSHFSILTYSLLLLKNKRYKRRLKNYYNTRISEVDLSKPYVIFNLHYQPEATTSPRGDIFVDQSLCIDVLLKHLPEHYFVYVKEHPAQFHSHREGHTGRMKEFYSDLMLLPRVRLVPLNFDPFELVKNSKAVATVTGTIGWESMALGKPVIIFGLTWYEKYKGVLKVTDEKSASGIQRFIENYNFDERGLLSYLAALSKNSVKAYYYRGLKEKLNMPEEECVNNLANSIIEIVGKG